MPQRLPIIVFALVMAAIPFIPGMPPFWIVLLDNIGLSALVVGTVEAFSSFHASNFKEVIVFTLIIPVLLLRSLAAPAVEEEKD